MNLGEFRDEIFELFMVLKTSRINSYPSGAAGVGGQGGRFGGKS